MPNSNSSVANLIDFQNLNFYLFFYSCEDKCNLFPVNNFWNSDIHFYLTFNLCSTILNTSTGTVFFLVFFKTLPFRN